MKRLFDRLARLLLVGATLAPFPTTAAEWKPTDTMQMIVASGAGGAHDVISRAMSRIWEKHFGVKLIVQNMGGAGGTLGIDRVATSKPDGLTLGFASSNSYIGEFIESHFPWKAENIPMIVAAETPSYTVSVSAKGPFKKWEDLRTANRRIRIGVAATLSTEVVVIRDLLNHGREITTGTMSTNAIITSLIAGDLDIWCVPTSKVFEEPYRKGDIRALAVLDTKRDPMIPDVPMLTDLGMPSEWNNVRLTRVWYAPIGTPREIVEGTEKRMKALMADPEIKDWLWDNGFVRGTLTGQQALESLRGMAKIIRDNDDIYKKYGG